MNPYDPPQVVGKSARPLDWFHYLNAIVVALAVVVTIGFFALLAFGAVADSVPPR